MDRRRILRLAAVLVIAQLRGGRGTTKPNSFFGRPISILVLDAVVGLGVFALAINVLSSAQARDPGLVALALREALPVLPLLAVGGVILAGVLFELNTSSRFTTSDAVNWLPISPEEYVLASAISIAYSDSLVAALAGAVAIALAASTGAYAAGLLAVVLVVIGLVEGGLVVEMIRSTTQRASAAITGRAGRTALVLRAGVFLGVILVFELFFNPVVLIDLLHSFNSIGLATAAIPLLWGSFALEEWLSGNLALGLVFTVLEFLLVGFFWWTAARFRVQFWAPAPAEVRSVAHEYGEAHGWLGALGLSRVESALVAKDLRGLVRRRELLPTLMIPVVLLIVVLVGGVTGAGASDGFLGAIYVVWLTGFGSLLLASTSFGQERRAVQNLYQLPIAPASVFRSKSTLSLLVGGVFALGFSILAGILYRLPLGVVVGLLVIDVAVVFASTYLGLSLASRYSDFQERPRPQYVRPWAMLLGMVVGLMVIFGIAVPGILALFTLAGGGPFPTTEVAISAGVAVASISILAALARSGTYRLMAELPV
jgi:hypothetical protein